MIDASEVDLPVPVAPTKMIVPGLVIARVLMIGGRFSSSLDGILVSFRRSTMPNWVRWWKHDPRQRPKIGRATGRERVGTYGQVWGVAVSLTKKSNYNGKYKKK